jgi:hypothetical protein
MKSLLFALCGTASATAALGIVGFVWGGFVGAAPCHQPDSFLSGGIMGAAILVSEFGAWAAASGFAIGFVVALLKTTAEQ